MAKQIFLTNYVIIFSSIGFLKNEHYKKIIFSKIVCLFWKKNYKKKKKKVSE